MRARITWWHLARGAIARPGTSREFVDDVLGELAGRGFGLSAWMTFIGRSLVRSLEQVRERPAAAGEVTAIHLIAGAAGSRRWALLSWFLCISHLGLLGESTTLGWPNRLTLVRALLPALAPHSRSTSLVAMGTDLADGWLASHGRETAFGAFADPIADGVFWSWYALRWEPSRWLRWVPMTIFGALLAGISSAYFVRGRAIDYPRLSAWRYAAAAAEILLATRILRITAR